MVEDPHCLVGRIRSISISHNGVVATVITGDDSFDQSLDDIGRDGGNSLERHSVESKGGEE